MGKFRGELWATLRDIRPPSQALNIALYPYVLAGRTNIYNHAAEEKGDVERKDEFHGGVDFKYDLTTQLALDPHL